MVTKLSQDDWREYKELRLLSVQTDPTVYFSSYDELSKWSDGNFKAELFSNSEIFGYLGAFDDDRLVGYISLSRMYFAKQRHSADVFNLYVHPDFRRNGVAQELVKMLIREARSIEGLEKLFLSVMAHNHPAIELYTKLGFIAYGTKPHSLKMGTDYYDELLMHYSLV